MPAPVRPTIADVSVGAIAHNVRVLASRAPGSALCAVVKADGYGHGGTRAALAALDAGVSWLAVGLVEEAEALRLDGITAPILLLSEPVGQVEPEAVADMADRLLAAGVTPSVATSAFADVLGAAAGRRGQQDVSVHLAVDTGMGRVGCRPDDVSALLAHPALRVDGAWTHMARGDDDATLTMRQLATWGTVVDEVRAVAPDAIVHAANSATALRHVAAHLDMVRVGIALYGLSPAPHLPAHGAGLRQALTLRTRVSFAKHVPAGTPVSYGHTASTPADGWLATLPIGYGDGMPRSLSNRATVLLGGRRHPIIGRVTMDQVLVFTGAHEPRIGDEAILLGGDADAPDDPTRFVSVDEWAEADDTISYEITCRLSARLPRRSVDA